MDSPGQVKALTVGGKAILVSLFTTFAAISHLVSSDPRNAGFSSTYSSTSASSSKTPLLANLSSFYRTLRATIKTILATPDSRRIFFFLCLNLAYMVIQMIYGVLTNSLGLISDCECPVVISRNTSTDLKCRSYPHVLRLFGPRHGFVRECDGYLGAKREVYIWV